MKRTLAVLVLLSPWTFGATLAHADNSGAVGSIVNLERNTDSADTFLVYNGRVYLKNLNGGLDEYRWGGTSCGSRDLTDAEFATLQAAQNNKKMLIKPLWQLGQGSVHCLVGIGTLEKKNLSLFP